eukprot:SAG22_NODE_234_length_14360_cov_13.245915_13_plen_275_part_00
MQRNANCVPAPLCISPPALRNGAPNLAAATNQPTDRPTDQPDHAANFGFYNLLGGLWLKHASTRRLGTAANPLVGLLLGMTSGAAAQFLCCPFTTLTLRMAASHERFRVALAAVLRADGIGGLWRGMRAGLLMTPRPAISFLVVENLKRAATRLAAGGVGGAALSFGAGFGGEAVATTAVYPLALARMQQAAGTARKPEAADRGESIREVLARTWNAGDFFALYAGCATEVVATALKGALRWLVKDQLNAACTGLVLRVALLIAGADAGAGPAT